MNLPLFSTEGFEFSLRWFHYLAGITWIGLLYYFNFVQGEWFKETDASAKGAAVQKLVPRALWWFRWGAMFTFITGVSILMNKGHMAGFEVYTSSWGIFILTGALLGTFMFLNVWMIIWPNQQIVIAAANGKKHPNAAACGAKAALASRTNTLFSIPMLFFMGAASHLPLNVDYDYNGWALSGVLGAIICGLQLNAVCGKPGPMASVRGVITSGFVLIAVLYLAMEALT